MHIEVTAQNIEDGLRQSPAFCPVARAIRDLHPHLPISVGVISCSIGGKAYKLPETVSEFIELFDRYRQVYPFSFELEPYELP